MSNGYDTAVQKYSGTTHIFTARSKNDVITLKAGQGETLSIDATIQNTSAPRLPISYGTSTIDATGSSISLNAGSVLITGTRASTSTTIGALVVSGGLGVGGALYVTGSVNTGSLTSAYTYTDVLSVSNSIVDNFRATSSTIGSLLVTGTANFGSVSTGAFSIATGTIQTATASSLSVTNLRPQNNYNYEYAVVTATGTNQVFTTGTFTAMTLFGTNATARPGFMTTIGMTCPSTSTVSITSAGVFLVTAQCSFVPDATMACTLSIYNVTDSVLIAASSKSVVTGVSTSFSVSGIAVVPVASKTLQCYFQHNKGTNFTLTAADLTNFTVTRIASI